MAEQWAFGLVAALVFSPGMVTMVGRIKNKRSLRLTLLLLLEKPSQHRALPKPGTALRLSEFGLSCSPQSANRLTGRTKAWVFHCCCAVAAKCHSQLALSARLVYPDQHPALLPFLYYARVTQSCYPQ